MTAGASWWLRHQRAVGRVCLVLALVAVGINLALDVWVGAVFGLGGVVGALLLIRQARQLDLRERHEDDRLRGP